LKVIYIQYISKYNLLYYTVLFMKVYYIISKSFSQLIAGQHYEAWICHSQTGKIPYPWFMTSEYGDQYLEDAAQYAIEKIG